MRRYGCIPDLVGAGRAHKFSAARPTLTASQLPEESDDLSPWLPKRMSQYSEGCCVWHGVTAALRYNWIVNGLQDIPLSRNDGYYRTRLREGTTASDAGCQIHNAIDVAMQEGVCAESLWPYDLTRWMEAPPDSVAPDRIKHLGLEKLSVDPEPLAIRTALLLGKPVIIGASIFPSFESDIATATGMIPMPGSTERVLSGHCIDIFRRTSTGWNGRPGLHFLNWWEEYDPVTGEVIVPWGINGTGVFSEDYCEYLSDLWLLTMTQEVAS